MSPRHLSRVFRDQLGMTPGKFVELARLEAARRLLEECDAPMIAIAARVGLGSEERMRQSFARHLDLRPIDYRGGSYIFASESCRAEFAADPESILGSQGSSSSNQPEIVDQ